MNVPRRGRIVIVGGGPAGAAAAVALRAQGHEGDLVMLCAEPVPPYSRPPLSKAVLRGEVALADLTLDTADAECRFGVRAERIDPDARLVTASDGDVLPYDGLVLATGLTPRRPADPAVAVLATAADAAALAPRLDRAASVAVVGSGFLACELASAARTSGAETTLVVRPGALTARYGLVGELLLRRALAADVRVVPTTAGSFERGGVRTAEGERIDADLVVAAIGASLDTALLPGHSGFVADDRCRLRPDVVVAGDAASIRSGDHVRHDRTWTNALAQGAAAARALLHADAPAFAPTPYAWTEAFGVDVKLAGAPPVAVTPTVVDGDLEADRALLSWPGGAAAIGYRIPVMKLRALAASGPATLDA